MSISRLIAFPLLLLALIGGCDTIEEETGISKKAQIGAVIGAGAGAGIAAAADGNAGWIVGSAAVGALAGGLIGDWLDDDDKKEAGRSAEEAMNTKTTGESITWNNPDSGRNGSMQIDDHFTKDDGTECKRFTEKTAGGEGGKDVTVQGTACKQEDGSWKVVES